MAGYLTLFAIVVLSLVVAILLDRKHKNLTIGVAGGLALGAICWVTATMLFYWLVP